MRGRVAGLLVLVLLGGGAVILARWPEQAGVPPPPSAPVEERAVVSVGGAVVYADVADASDEWARGLSHRLTLAPDTGMLFRFPDVAPRVFWMKDTSIPLDLVWIREGSVVSVTANVLPEPGVPDAVLRLYSSPGPVDTVLEVNAGWAAARGVTAGARVTVRRSLEKTL